jgi:glycosyltransferase involved in cell wall biosynthesis
MLFGMPAIVTDMVGAGYDLVEPGMTGYVYKVGDIEQLTLYLSELLSNPGKRAAMGNAAQTRVCSYSYEACVQGIVRAVEVAGRRH